MLRMNIGTEPPSLDWQVSSDSVSFDVVSNIMVGLTQYNDKLQCDPACASSWEVLDDGRRYLFHLRHDVHWSDGKTLVAGDFEYAWKRMLDPKTGAAYAFFLYDIENAYEFNTGAITDSSKVGVKALDDYTLEVKLKKPAAYFLYLTAFCPSYPQRRDVIERWGDRWTEPEHIVTNGPFLLKSWAHEYKIELAAWDGFFEGAPKLKAIKMFMIPEQSTAFALYQNDELDYIDNRSFSTPDVEANKHSPEYHNIALLRNNYVGFNITKRPFTDVRVRRAVSMAIDRRVFPIILRRNERPAYCWIPPQLQGYSPSSEMHFNAQEARKLLSEAGYPDGKGFPNVGLLYPEREDTRLIVEAVQDQLKRNLNIHVDLVNQEWKVYLETLRRDPPPIYRASWGADYPDPETFMNLFTSRNGNNDTRFASKAYDQLLAQAGSEQNAPKRAALYAEADRIVCRDQCLIATTFLSTQNLMVKPWVHGMQFNPLDIQFYKDVTVDNWSPPLVPRPHHPSPLSPVAESSQRRHS